VAGERWRIVYHPLNLAASPATKPGEHTHGCSATIVVQPQDANPLRAARNNSPHFGADEATVQATLVAAQLEDINQAAWHAWLLSTLAPTDPAAQDLGATLWLSWWKQHSTQASAPKPTAP
jgi:hypothetical protein